VLTAARVDLLSASDMKKKKKQNHVRFGVPTEVTMKNVVFWDTKTQFVPQRRHITSPLQSPALLILCNI
jgi:hypothetical protein